MLTSKGVFNFAQYILKRGVYLIEARPKKPLPSFIKFCMENNDPSKGAIEVTKSASEAWKMLSENEKAKYSASEF